MSVRPRTPSDPRKAALLGVAILALAGFGGQRVLARRSTSSAGPRCVPTALDRSALLPGTTLTVSPLPDSYSALGRTQISLLGAPASTISDVKVRGSATGAHSGRLEPYSQGDGASFVPSKPFQPGETVTVFGRQRRGKALQRFAFRFTVALPDPVAHATPSVKSAGKPGETDVFHSRPDLHAPTVAVTSSSPQATPGYIFAAPYSGPGQDGPMIFDESGNLVWFHALPSGTESTNLQVQQYEGKPVLTWWQGYIPPQGFGEGEEVVASASYAALFHVHAGNGYTVDLHDFHLLPDNRAVLTVFQPIHCDLSSVHGPRDGAVTDSLFEEVDLKTRLVRREWNPVDHVGLSQSYASASGSSTAWPFDYFHLNSVDEQPSGSILISSRNTSAMYELNGSTQQISSRIGGKQSSEKLSKGASTAYQHDAQELPNGEISIFDNGGVPMVHPQSRGLIVSIDPQTNTDTLVTEFNHAGTPLKAGSQGNMQLLESGDYFVGWGAEPYFSEYAPSGTTVFDAHLPAKTESYRGYRFSWSATPYEAPAIAAASSKGSLTVYASWNGATTVASWRVLGGASPKSLAPLATASFGGFETAIPTPGAPAYVEVQALGSTGAVLASSKAIKG